MKLVNRVNLAHQTHSTRQGCVRLPTYLEAKDVFGSDRFRWCRIQASFARFLSFKKAARVRYLPTDQSVTGEVARRSPKSTDAFERFRGTHRLPRAPWCCWDSRCSARRCRSRSRLAPLSGSLNDWSFRGLSPSLGWYRHAASRS